MQPIMIKDENLIIEADKEHTGTSTNAKSIQENSIEGREIIEIKIADSKWFKV